MDHQYPQQQKYPHSLTNHYGYGSIGSIASSSSSSLSLSPTVSLSSLSSVQSDSDGSSAEHAKKSELKRSLSTFTTFGLAFSNIGILANTSATFQTALQRGGPITVLLGWNLVGFLAIAVSLSFAEICSIYPTSGGLYIWIYEMLKHSRLKNHATSIAIASGCIYTIGNIITLGATNVSIALSLGSLLKIVFNYELYDHQLLFITLCITVIQTILNCRYMNVLAWLNKLNVFWSCVGLFLVVLVLSLFASSHQDPLWVFTHYENRTGFDNIYYVFVLGMIGATYTMFGSECSASMSEETENADITSPIAMVTSITTAWIFGFIYLIVLLFSIQDIESVLTTSYNLPVTQVFIDAVGTPATIGFLCLMILCQFCSGATTLTVTSRQVFSLARGGGIPYHQQLQQLNNHQIPSKAVMAVCSIACGMVAPYPLSDLFYEIIISAATITVYLTYSLVLGCKLWIGSGNRKGRFHLGPLSKPITAIAFFWSLFAIIAFTLPTCWPIDVANANYAGPALFGVIIISFLITYTSSPSTHLY